MNIHLISQPIPFHQFSPFVIALGFFDGVHVGHQEVVKRARCLADICGTKLGVMTFSPHPRQVLGKDPQYEESLTPLEEKARLFEYLGVDSLFVVEFSEAFSRIEPIQFVENYLLPIPTVGVAAGFDFRFGRGGMGNADDLVTLGGRFGFQADIISPVQLDGIKVSSSLVREYLMLGRVELAAELLGRPYRFKGIVIHGDKRGRTIGFPTANLQLQAQYVLPQNGVYVVAVKSDSLEQFRLGVMNIGTKPTFYQNGFRSIEVHLLDFQGDLYDQPLEVEVLHRLREEQKFSSVSDLIRQLQQDVARARAFISL